MQDVEKTNLKKTWRRWKHLAEKEMRATTRMKTDLDLLQSGERRLYDEWRVYHWSSHGSRCSA